MKKVILLNLILVLTGVSTFALESSLYDSQNSNDSNSNYNINSGSYIGNTYYNNNPSHPVSYTQDGDKIYGSDGSSYTRFGNTIQNNATGQTYQINNNLIQPLY